MTTVGEGLDAVLREHPFFEGLSEEYLKLLAGCGKNERFEQGEFLFRENGEADRFYIVRHGLVRIELFSTRRGPILLETVGPGSVLGWSWLVPPYRWRFDAKALELTRVVSMDGTCLRKKSEDDPQLGGEPGPPVPRHHQPDPAREHRVHQHGPAGQAHEKGGVPAPGELHPSGDSQPAPRCLQEVGRCRGGRLPTGSEVPADAEDLLAKGRALSVPDRATCRHHHALGGPLGAGWRTAEDRSLVLVRGIR